MSNKDTKQHGKAQPPPDDTSLAARLNWLFEKIRRPDGEPYSLREVADRINEEANKARGEGRIDDAEGISYSYIGQLRNDEKRNPKLSHLRGLARFFGVPVAYFTDETITAEVRHELHTYSVLQGLRANNIALRDTVIPSALETMAVMEALIKQISELESRRDGTDPES